MPLNHVSTYLQQLDLWIDHPSARAPSKGRGPRAKRQDLPRLFVLQLLLYDAPTGVFIWRHGRLAGQIAGRVSNASGYRQIYLTGYYYYAHVLAWLVLYDEWLPDLDIDHQDGNRDHNAQTNLRKLTHAENCRAGHQRRREQSKP